MENTSQYQSEFTLPELGLTITSFSVTQLATAPEWEDANLQQDEQPQEFSRHKKKRKNLESPTTANLRQSLQRHSKELL